MRTAAALCILFLAPFSTLQADSAPQADLRAIISEAAVPAVAWDEWADYRTHLEQIYGARDFEPLWFRGGRPTPQASAVLAHLGMAETRGLRTSDYDSAGLKKQFRLPSTPEERARADVALTAAVYRYASDLHVGRVDPNLVLAGYDIESRRRSIGGLVAQLATAENMATAIAELDPAYPAYRRLQEALPRYRRIAAAGDQPALPGEGMVRPGERYDGATQLAAFLQRTGDLRKSHRGDLYDGSLAVAVRRFQRRHGLPDDGIIGAETRRELDVPLSRRVRQIELALERWRSIPSFERPPVLVNIPEFKLYALDENLRPALEMKVIVGQALLHNTLVFQSTISSLVFQPTWNVPPSIQQSEIVPRLQRDRGYLARKGFEVVRHGQASSGTRAVTDSILADLRAGRRAIRQKPGSANALGQLKFVLRNDGNIYLHDTPSKELFDEARRDFSHGCIRVQQPAALAAWLLRDTAGWTGARIQRAMRSGDGTRELSLGAPVPILMMYATAAVAPDGEVRFFRDIYGYDERLERELMQRRAGDRMAEASEVPGSERGSRPRAAVQPDPDNGR